MFGIKRVRVGSRYYDVLYKVYIDAPPEQQLVEINRWFRGAFPRAKINVVKDRVLITARDNQYQYDPTTNSVVLLKGLRPGLES